MSREDYKKGTVRPYGFTDYKTIQTFQFVGAVYTCMFAMTQMDRPFHWRNIYYEYDNSDLTILKLTLSLWLF